MPYPQEIPFVTQSKLNQLFSFMETGGPVIWTLALFSLFASAIALLKFWQIWRSTFGINNKISSTMTLWTQGAHVQAIDQLSQSKQPVTRLMLAAMRGILSHGDHPALREELNRLATLEIENLRSYLRPLEIIASLSPLLGLLGTVMGMIVAFQQMELAGHQVDPSTLSGGIWQALLTTAAGLILAIPVLILHSYFERQTELIAHQIENNLSRILTSDHAFTLPLQHREKAHANESTRHSVSGV